MEVNELPEVAHPSSAAVASDPMGIDGAYPRPPAGEDGDAMDTDDVSVNPSDGIPEALGTQHYASEWDSLREGIRGKAKHHWSSVLKRGRSSDSIDSSSSEDPQLQEPHSKRPRTDDVSGVLRSSEHSDDTLRSSNSTPYSAGRRRMPRRESALARSFKNIYGVSQFWETTGDKPTDISFVTEEVSLPPVREIGTYDQEEEALALLRQSWKKRFNVPTPPVDDLWFTSVESNPPSEREERSTVSSDMPSLLRDWDATKVEELLHSDELEEFNKLLIDIAGEAETSIDEDVSDTRFVRLHWTLELTERWHNTLKSPFPLSNTGEFLLPPYETFIISPHRQTYERSAFPSRILEGNWPEAKLLPEYIPEGLIGGPEVFLADPNQGSLQFVTPAGLAGNLPRPPPTPIPKPSRSSRNRDVVLNHSLIPKLSRPPSYTGFMRPLPPYAPLYCQFQWEVVKDRAPDAPPTRKLRIKATSRPAPMPLESFQSISNSSILRTPFSFSGFKAESSSRSAALSASGIPQMVTVMVPLLSPGVSMSSTSSSSVLQLPMVTSLSNPVQFSALSASALKQDPATSSKSSTSVDGSTPDPKGGTPTPQFPIRVPIMFPGLPANAASLPSNAATPTGLPLNLPPNALAPLLSHNMLLAAAAARSRLVAAAASGAAQSGDNQSPKSSSSSSIPLSQANVPPILLALPPFSTTSLLTLQSTLGVNANTGRPLVPSQYSTRSQTFFPAMPTLPTPLAAANPPNSTSSSSAPPPTRVDPPSPPTSKE